MSEVHIITPLGMFGQGADDDALDAALRIIGVGFGEEGGWNSKYGADFENDVFLMKRYCWCERDDCPWCAGCGAFKGECRACANPEAHGENCYRTELEAEEIAAGVHWKLPDRLPYAKRERIQNAIYDRLCAKHGVSREFGAAVHCTCGADDRNAKSRDEIGCDYHRGRGMFARFAPWTADRERGYYDPPNFWFKPDDFRVTWYKYIGRDMAANKDSVSPDFLERIFATHPRGMTLQDAIEETARQMDETAKGFADMFARLGIKTA